MDGKIFLERKFEHEKRQFDEMFYIVLESFESNANKILLLKGLS